MKKTKEMTLKETITDILTKFPATRDNDLKLIVKYCKKTGKSTDLKDWVNDKHNALESIGRCRRLIQHNNPELRASEAVRAGREETRKYVEKAVA